MKTSINPKANGILVTLTFIALFFVSLIVILVADIDAGAFFDDQVNVAINTEVQSRVTSAAANPAASTSSTAKNEMFYELGAQ